MCDLCEALGLTPIQISDAETINKVVVPCVRLLHGIAPLGADGHPESDAIYTMIIGLKAAEIALRTNYGMYGDEAGDAEIERVAREIAKKFADWAKQAAASSEFPTGCPAGVTLQ